MKKSELKQLIRELIEDQRICNRCEYFEVSPGRCIEICHAIRIDPTMTLPYAEERINGNKTKCKSFRKINKND